MQDSDDNLPETPIIDIVEESPVQTPASSSHALRLNAWRQKAAAVLQRTSISTPATPLTEAKLESPRKDIGLASPANGDAPTKDDKVEEQTNDDGKPPAEPDTTTPRNIFGDDAASDVSSSHFTTSTNATATSRLQWAAMGMVQEMQQIKGRYNNAPSQQTTPISTPTRSAAKQTRSTPTRPQNRYLQQLQGECRPHEYVLLLGQKMLGVNLKQAYKRHKGAYIDYLVDRGAAANAGTVIVGDSLQKINGMDCQSQTILEIPTLIQHAQRPAAIIFSHKHIANAEDSSPVSLNYLDVAVAWLHHFCPFREEDDHASSSDDEEESDSSDDDSSEAQSERALRWGRTADEGQQGAVGVNNDAEDPLPPALHETFSASVPCVSNWLDLEQPKPECFEPLAELACLRCNASHFTMDAIQPHVHQPLLRNSLQHALLLCLHDARRYAFMNRYFSRTSHNALLVLVSELLHFRQEYSLQNNPYVLANRIAYKFFLPSQIHNELVPPFLDFHAIVPDMDLRALEQRLNAQDVDVDMFASFEQSAFEEMLAPFLKFCLSDDCARMRAYLRGVAPFSNIRVDQIIQKNENNGKILHFVFVYLLCQHEKEANGEHDDVLEVRGKRVEDAPHRLTAALFIRNRLVPALGKEDDEEKLTCMELFWEAFAAPGVGSLDMIAKKTDAMDVLIAFRAILAEIRAIEDKAAMMEKLCDVSVRDTLLTLSNELLYEYASHAHPQFKMHKFYEWMLAEMQDDGILPDGCIKRLLRKVDFPPGISSHKHTHEHSPASAGLILPDTNDRRATVGASADDLKPECAVVFGTVFASDLSSAPPGAMKDTDIKRYATVPLRDVAAVDSLLPPTLETYTNVPMARPQPFQTAKSSSIDGWEISLVDFFIPHAGSDSKSASGEDTGIFGVSLVLHSRNVTRRGPTEVRLVGKKSDDETITINEVDDNSDDPGDYTLKVPVTGPTKEFNDYIAMRRWTERITSQGRADDDPITIGIALVSRSNTLLSMRDALSSFLQDVGQTYNTEDFMCNQVANVLGNFAHEDIDNSLLSSILEPYLSAAAKPWLERPLTAQREDFVQLAGQRLLANLPPIPVALMFVTALLEQKIVLTTSRRSLLFSATTALQELLKPLSWCHLLVPRVPAELAADLLQYPAPFILGLPSEDPGMMDLIRDLPQDVTLVDLDVGRVILAPLFCHTSELGRGVQSSEQTLRQLRSQVLYLAQSIGIGIFGMDESWSVDRPVLASSRNEPQISPFDRLRQSSCHLIEELLAGTSTCCYWIQEDDSQEPTVLFDEDRFFAVKRARQTGFFTRLFQSTTTLSPFSMNVDDFDLVLQVWLRCQNVNLFISRLGRSEML